MRSEKSVKNYNTCDESDASNYNDESDASNYIDYSNTDPNTYFRKINLRYFSVESLRMFNDHARLKELCLENDNPKAHYNEGLLHYFLHNDKHKGLYHLRQLATGNNENGMYLYGLLMLARCHYPKGKKYLDKLQWKKKISTSDHFWERINNSFSVIHVPTNRRYYVNMVNLEPQTNCECDDMNKVCKDCYYYKRLNQFFHSVTKKEENLH